MDPFVKEELSDFIDQSNPTQTHSSLPPLHQSDPSSQTTDFDSASTEPSGFGCFDPILNSALQDFSPNSEIADFIKQENPSSQIPNHQPDLDFSGKRVSDATDGDSNKKRKVSKQFWKAGDYEDSQNTGPGNSSVGMDHVRVHPKFLHSNATSHKWALGAFAELLDNSLDEVCYGATFVNVDVLQNNKDMSRMLLIEDDGGGMTPDKMRSCMSLGYSAKSKLANVIGQYGNGFKTSTMRLGADVIVFSRSCSGTQSIGMLSYTFLKGTGKEDIVVPILDFEKGENGWNKLIRSSLDDWDRNAKVIVQWSPYSSEDDLFDQFNLMSDHGTRVIIYNLWEDDEGELELDFLADPHDIQIRGGNRDDNLKKLETVKEFSTSSLILSYRHSLRSYASIIYLRLPPAFRIVLRGKEVEHHNIVNDLILTEKITYRPKPDADRVGKDRNMVTTVTIGFVKDAKDHRDVQGFNVYHKNRLIKPFWRLWNAAGSEGRGSIAVLEANFVEPAHDKQGFERTALLQRLEQRLLDMQKTYWYSQCQKIGYAPRQRQNKPLTGSAARDSDIRTTTFKPIPNESVCEASFNEKSYQRTIPHVSQSSSRNSDNGQVKQAHSSNGNTEQILTYTPIKAVDGPCNEKTLTSYINLSALNYAKVQNWKLQYRLRTLPESYRGYLELEREKSRSLQSQVYVQIDSESHGRNPTQLRIENIELKKNLKKMEESFSHDLHAERHQCTSLEAKLKESEMKIEEINGKQESLIDMFAEERNRRDNEQANLRMKLKDASSTIDSLLDKVRWLENIKQE